MAQSETAQKQLTANRANAARSTGPRTPERKARSAQNSRKHGFQELFGGASRPERIALAQHALLRAARLEAGLFTCAVNQALDDDGNFLNPISTDCSTARNDRRPEPQPRPRRRIPPHGERVRRVEAFLPLPGPDRAQLPPGHRGIRPPQSLSARNYRTNRFSRPNPNPLSRLRPLQTNPFGPRKTLRATPGPLGSGSHSSLPALVPAGLRSAPLAIPLRCRAPGHARGSTAHPVQGKPPPPTSPAAGSHFGPHATDS